MEAVYCNVKFKNQRARERGDGKPSETANPGHSNLPGPHDPADSSPEAVTPAWTKGRLLLRSLCVILFAAGLVITVLYVLGNFSQKEKFISEKQHNEALKNYTGILKDKEKMIDQLQLEIQNLKTSPKAVSNEDCANDWKYFGGKCYHFFDEKKTWIGSRDACLAAGGHLVIITSTEERDFIKRLVKSCADAERYWIGLTDAVVEGDWRWLDGTKLSQTPKYWARNEPDNWNGQNNEHLEGEDCGLMYLSTTFYELWDGFCNVEAEKYKYVCETKSNKMSKI